jgi:hypothetical protein
VDDALCVEIVDALGCLASYVQHELKNTNEDNMDVILLARTMDK